MNIFLSILILIAAIMLILIVVIQNSKGGGLAAGFGESNKYMGVRKTTDFLEKATWVLAGTIVLLSIASSHFFKPSNRDEAQSTFIENTQQATPVQPTQSETLPVPGVAGPAETPTPTETPAAE